MTDSEESQGLPTIDSTASELPAAAEKNEEVNEEEHNGLGASDVVDEDIRPEHEEPTRNELTFRKSIDEAEEGNLADPVGDKRDNTDDENTVFWDGDNDPENPYNWPVWLKVLNCGLISGLTFVTPLASSMFAPGVPTLMAQFGSTSSLLGSFCVSVYVLGFAAGPLLFAPLSELYGRQYVYHGCNLGFIAFIIACAKAPTLNTLIVFRFFSGVFGSCPLTNGGGSIADMIVQEHRGAAMASFAIGPLLGPIIGPVVGGVVANALGWRWVFWILAAISGVITVAFIIFSRETYAPVILKRKVARLRKQTENPLLRSKLDGGLTPRDYFSKGLVRPLKMLALSPVCIICGAYVGLTYAYLYLMFTSLTPLFERIYGFDTVHAGLTFLGLGVGSMLGVAYFSSSSDRYIKKMAARDDALAEAEGRPKENMIKPEYRLPPLRIGAVLMPAGFFIYGWTAQYRVYFLVPIIGTAIIGVGNLIIFMSLQMYLIDSFSIYAASALASNTVVRSVAGALLPLAGIPMYDKLQLGWGNSLLGFIAVAMIPAPFLFMKYGEYLRKRFEIKNL